MSLWLSAIEVATLAGVPLASALGLASIRISRHRRDAQDAREMLNNLTEGVYRSSIDGKQISANRALVRLNGFSSEREMLATVNRTKDDAIAAEWYVDPRRRAEFQRLLHRDGFVTDFVSEIYRHKTRERIWISENARLVLCPKTGVPHYYEGTVRDISETIRKRAAEERLNKLADVVPGGLFQMRRTREGGFEVTYASQPFRALLGVAPDDTRTDPTSHLAFIHPEDRGHYISSLRESAEKLSQWHCTFRYRDESRPDHVWLSVSAHTELTADGSIVWSGCLADVSAQKGLMAEIEKLAYHDTLTELPNRRLLVDRLAEACKLHRRRRRHAALLFIDLDGFKAINDSHGHQAGDDYIRKIAARLKESVRESDTVSRFGGDEFVILLHDLDVDVVQARADAAKVTEKIMGNLRRGIEFANATQPVGCSVGIRVFKGNVSAPDALIRDADQAMYRAKALGRNRYCQHDESAAAEPEADRRASAKQKAAA